MPWLCILAFVVVHVPILFCSGMVQGPNSAKISVWWDWFSARLVPCKAELPSSSARELLAVTDSKE